MDIGKWICDVSNRVYRRLGMRVVRMDLNDGRIITQYGSPPEVTLRRLSWMLGQLQFKPVAIVDVGASDGRWTRPALQFFPEARFLLIEPLSDHQTALATLQTQQPGVEFVQRLVGRAHGTATLMSNGFQSSVLPKLDGQSFGRPIEVAMSTLDEIIAEREFPAPDFIKLDIEGGELDALHGATQALASAQIVELEFSLIPFKKNLPLLDDIVIYMSDCGFRIMDVFGVYGRPLDGLPVQGECFFMRKDSPLLRDLRWSKEAAWS